MTSKTNIHDPSVQYIATQDFMQTLLSDQSISSGLLDMMYDSYDLMADPGIDQPGFNAGATGTGHRMERDFMDEYRGRNSDISAQSKRLALGKKSVKTGNRNVPWALIAMAMQRSTDGKRRVVLTDDEGLMELLQYYGIETMESDDFKEKLEKDKQLKPGSPGFSKDKHNDSIVMARKLDDQRIQRGLEPSGPDMPTNSDETNEDESARRQRLGGIDMDV